LLSWRFALNHQNYWSWHHPYSLPMPMWNSSPSMHGYPLGSYFDPWCGSLCYGGLPNYFTYRWSWAEIFILVMHALVDEFIWPIFWYRP
jgi:hypothetical protein